MSTRRAVRASRATRTTRRTVEQQQQLQQHLQLDFSSGDAYGVLTGGGFSSGVGPTQPSSAPGSGDGGGFGFGGASSSGAYNSHRHFSRGTPARKWIRVRRPPAAGVGFRIDVWVPADQLTDVERAAHLPPSTKPSEEVLADAAAVAAAPSLPVGVEATKTSDGGGGDDAADATAQSLTAVSEPRSGATNSERLQGPDGLDQANVLSVHPANEDVEMETLSPRETAVAEETDPTSPNDRPAKRARFAHEDDGTQGHGDDADGSDIESRRPDVSSSTSPIEGAGVETSSSTEDTAGEAPTVPSHVGETSLEGSAEASSVVSAVPPSQSGPASEDVANRPSADSDRGRKRDLADCCSDKDRPVGKDAEEHGECDGPPLKRARAAADDDNDNDDAVDAATGSANDAPSLGVMAPPAKSAEVPAAGSGATSNVAARGEGSAPATGVDDGLLPVRGHGHPSQGGMGESADEPSFEPKDDVPR